MRGPVAGWCLIFCSALQPQQWSRPCNSGMDCKHASRRSGRPHRRVRIVAHRRKSSTGADNAPNMHALAWAMRRGAGGGRAVTCWKAPTSCG